MVIVARAQTPDSLFDITDPVTKSLPPSARIEKTLKYATVLLYQRLDTEKAIRQGQIALDLAREHQLALQEAHALDFLGRAYRQQNDYTRALGYFHEALPLLREQGDLVELGNLLNSLGTAYRHLNRYKEALAYYFEAMEIREKLGNDKRGLASTISSIGNVHRYIGDYENALFYLQKSLQYDLEINYRQGIAYSYNDIGVVYLRQNRTKEAIEYLEKALAVKEEIQDRSGIPTTLTNMAEAYAQQQKYKEALDFSIRAYNLKKDGQDRKGQGYTSIAVGKYYYLLHRYEEAKPFLIKGLALARGLASVDMSLDALSTLYELHADTRDYQSALVYYRQYQALKDSTLNNQYKKEIAELQSTQSIKEKEKEMAQLVETNRLREEKDAAIQRVLVVLALVLLVAGGVSFYSYRSKVRSNQKLRDQNELIRRQNEQLQRLDQVKNDLMGVVAHDLQSPYKQISGLIQLIMFEPDNLSEEQKLCLEKIGQISKASLRMIKDLMDIQALEQQKMSIVWEEFRLSDVVRDVLENYQQRAQSKGIRIEAALHSESLVRADKVLTARLLDNLVSNALKFSPSRTSILLSVTEGEGWVRAAVQDHGPGIKAEELPRLFQKFQKLSARPTAGEDSTGLGLSIVKLLADQMFAKLDVQSIYGEGATFSISFEKIPYSDQNQTGIMAEMDARR